MATHNGRRARFKVVARLDGRPASVTITIDRASGLLAVRPKYRRREYVVPLATVAEVVYARLVKAEVAARAKARRKR